MTLNLPVHTAINSPAHMPVNLPVNSLVNILVNLLVHMPVNSPVYMPVVTSQSISQFASPHASCHQPIFQSIFQWAKKEVLILDKISMVSLSILQEIENQLCTVRNSEETFGGLKVVLFCGDFFQFLPILGCALWQVLYPILMKFLQMPRVSGCGPNSGGLMSKCTNKMIWNIMQNQG